MLYYTILYNTILPIHPFNIHSSQLPSCFLHHPLYPHRLAPPPSTAPSKNQTTPPCRPTSFVATAASSASALVANEPLSPLPTPPLLIPLPLPLPLRAVRHPAAAAFRQRERDSPSRTWMEQRQLLPTNMSQMDAQLVPAPPHRAKQKAPPRRQHGPLCQATRSARWQIGRVGRANGLRAIANSSSPVCIINSSSRCCRTLPRGRFTVARCRRQRRGRARARQICILTGWQAGVGRCEIRTTSRPAAQLPHCIRRARPPPHQCQGLPTCGSACKARRAT